MKEYTKPHYVSVKTFRTEYRAVPSQPYIARYIDTLNRVITINTAAQPGANIDSLLPPGRPLGVRYI